MSELECLQPSDLVQALWAVLHCFADDAYSEEFQTEGAEMKKLILPTLTLIILQNSAFAAPGTATGPTALALAAVIAQHSPAVRAFDRRVIARLFRGNTRFGFTPNTTISVDADSAKGVAKLNRSRATVMCSAHTVQCSVRGSKTSRPRIQRYTKTGVFVCVKTLFVTLPSTTADSPPRPCDAMTMRSQPRSAAAATRPLQ